MKKRLMTILLVACLLSANTAYALSGSIVQETTASYSVNVQNATANSKYILLIQEGALGQPSASAEILYIAYVEANGTSWSKGGIIPRVRSVSSAFVIDEEGNAAKLGQILNFSEGDANKDGVVDDADLDLLVDALALLEDVDSQQMNAADIDRSGYLNIFDAVLLESKYLK